MPVLSYTLIGDLLLHQFSLDTSEAPVYPRGNTLALYPVLGLGWAFADMTKGGFHGKTDEVRFENPEL